MLPHSGSFISILSPFTVSTPINTNQLSLLLRPHPHPDLAATIVLALKSGFNIGFGGPRSSVSSPNLPSALLRPSVVDGKLLKETELGHIAGPFQQPPFPVMRCSGLGLVPNNVTDWRLIFHLSAPAGESVNDHIPPGDITLSYSSIDDAVAMLQSLGPGALMMAKADIKSVFRLCPVRPEDWPLLGMHWSALF